MKLKKFMQLFASNATLNSCNFFSKVAEKKTQRLQLLVAATFCYFIKVFKVF